MADLILYHNPRCSKSREALKLLQDNGQDFSTFLYLNEDLMIKFSENCIHAIENHLNNDVISKELVTHYEK